LWHFSQYSAEDNALAQDFLQQPIDLDANFAGGYTALVLARVRATGAFGKGTPADVQISTEELARRAVALDANDAEARTCFATELMRRGDYTGALAETDRALLASPNLASAHGGGGGEARSIAEAG
jgi:hypothetical protein